MPSFRGSLTHGYANQALRAIPDVFTGAVIGMCTRERAHTQVRPYRFTGVIVGMCTRVRPFSRAPFPASPSPAVEGDRPARARTLRGRIFPK
jgi:hypothetical protein